MNAELVSKFCFPPPFCASPAVSLCTDHQHWFLGMSPFLQAVVAGSVKE